MTNSAPGGVNEWKCSGRLPLVLLALLALPATATSQVLTTVEFSFSNPGARSMGFGSAFVSLADDATAAFANPAGLVQLAEPEVSVEGRAWRYTSVYTSGGRAAGQPTGLGIDTVSEPTRSESTASLSGLSFLSFVYPAGRWSFALYQHQLLNFEMTQEIQGIFAPGSVALGTWRGPIERAFFDFEVTTHALAAGYRFGDRLSLGVGLSHFDPSTYFTGDEYLPDDDTLGGYFALSSFPAERLSHHIRGEISEADWGLTVGALWRLSSSWQAGAVYREGPDFVLSGGLTAGPVNQDLPAGATVDLGSSPWSFPDVWGLGLSYRSPDGRWTAACEWSRVEYSTFIESLSPDLRRGGSTALEDADELHVGGEYAFFVGTSVVAVRLGAWLDPNHQVRGDASNPISRAEHLPGSDEIHLAAGVGIARERFQLDLGIDLSERRDSLSLSAIYNF